MNHMTSSNKPSENGNEQTSTGNKTELMRLAFLGNGADLLAHLSGPAHPDVNARDENGRTALMLAAVNGNEDCVKILIAAGADVNAKDNTGKTALVMAAPEVAALLRDAAARG